MIGYHYTSLETGLKILEAKTLRLSNIRTCNDGNEWLHGFRIASKVAGELGKPLNEHVNDHLIPFWICCFSTIEDDFSQWEKYGDASRGMCLAIDLDSVVCDVGEDSWCRQVNYDPPEAQETEIRRTLQ